MTDSNAVEKIKGLVNEVAAKRQASLLAAQHDFSKHPLDGVGEDAWKNLWESARRFSSFAYQGKQFPVTDDEAVCLLCQQTLDADSKDRLKQFEKFVSDDTAKELAKSEANLNSAMKAYADWTLGGVGYNNAVTELKEIDGKISTDMSSVVSGLCAIRNAIIQGSKGGEWTTRRLNVELAASAGEFGSSSYRVQLVGASGSDIGMVVSEGEHRCTVTQAKNKRPLK